MPTPINHVLVMLDQLAGFWGFLESMYRQARGRESGEAISSMLDQHQREIDGFSQAMEELIQTVEADGGADVLGRDKVALKTTELGHEHELGFEDTLEWCIAGERLAEKILDVALGTNQPTHIEQLMSAESARVQKRRVELEALLGALRMDAGVSPRHGSAKPRQLLLVQLTTPQRDAVSSTFLAQGIPSVSAQGPGEAVYRIVQDRPTLVLVSASTPGSLTSIIEQLSLSDPHVPVLSIDPKTLPASLTDQVQQIIKALVDSDATRSKSAR